MTPERMQEFRRAFERLCSQRRMEREEVLRLAGPESGQPADTRRACLREVGLPENFLEPPDPTALDQPLRKLTFDFRGLRLGDYELIEEIGRGASGAVYLCRQIGFGRPAAIKILAPHLCQSADRRARFEREAMAASKVRHPNVVSVLSHGEQLGVVFIVMEHVAGHTLHRYLEMLRARDAGQEQAQPMEPREAARIIGCVARGLAACHRAGVIHRDVKPQNILLDARLYGRPACDDRSLPH